MKRKIGATLCALLMSIALSAGCVSAASAAPAQPAAEYSWWAGGVDIYMNHSETRHIAFARRGQFTPATFRTAWTAVQRNKCIVLHVSWSGSSWAGIYGC